MEKIDLNFKLIYIRILGKDNTKCIWEILRDMSRRELKKEPTGRSDDEYNSKFKILLVDDVC